MRKPRGRCRYCGHTYSLNKDGKIRKHDIKGKLVNLGQVPS